MRTNRFIADTDLRFNIERVRSGGLSMQNQNIAFEGGFPTFDLY